MFVVLYVFTKMGHMKETKMNYCYHVLNECSVVVVFVVMPHVCSPLFVVTLLYVFGVCCVSLFLLLLKGLGRISTECFINDFCLLYCVLFLLVD